ncbi:MAG: hypothetical protein DI565_01125 [Ancylobacter novellus]|uniref:Carbon monoxide dehydrogenase n=1 Tax=Ancylobacter novellus TaxID=921 RepID=A0A2W5KSE3_ANCNO|nr:MAG: hypothetical protein DI565_01125 [Ancylobacter novellus]
MDLSGSRLIPAPIAAVRAALADPEMLKTCIPGCERLERTAGGAFEGTVATKIGPIRAAFAGTVTAIETADGWSLSAQGADSAAGSGRGQGAVTLSEAEGGALLSYQGTAEVEGKISQLGSRLVSGVARQSIETFLTNLAEKAEVAAPPADEPSPRTEAIEPPLADAPPLVHEEPAEPATEAASDAPPLADGVLPSQSIPIAPTHIPDVPDPVAIAVAEATESPKEGGGSVGRIMLVAAVAVIVGIAIYLGFLQRPPG